MPRIDYPPRPGFVFPTEPPKAVLDYIQSKSDKSSFDWRDMFREEHVGAFTVAKATDANVRNAIREEVEKAIKDGIPFSQFKKNLQPRLQKLGWWGVQEVVDPKTGEVMLAQLGSPSRLKKIFYTNQQQAYKAGQWLRIVEGKATHPYLLYLLGPSENHREEHVFWHGFLLPIDHPWWATHMPMNGWGCKCHVRQVTRREAEKLKDDGVVIPEQEIGDDGLPTGRLTKKRVPVTTEPPADVLKPWEDTRNGRTILVPEGIDPGFDYNPGQHRLQAQVSALNESKGLQGSDALKQTLVIAENNLRYRFTEKAYVINPATGAIAAERAGDVNSVSLADVALSQQVVTHNHPDTGGTFSDADWQLAIHNDVAELRAVDKDFRYQLQPGDAGWPAPSVLDATMAELWVTIHKKWLGDYRKGLITREDALAMAYHELYEKTAKTLNLNYQREAW